MIVAKSVAIRQGGTMANAVQYANPDFEIRGWGTRCNRYCNDYNSSRDVKIRTGRVMNFINIYCTLVAHDGHPKRTGRYTPPFHFPFISHSYRRPLRSHPSQFGPNPNPVSIQLENGP